MLMPPLRWQKFTSSRAPMIETSALFVCARTWAVVWDNPPSKSDTPRMHFVIIRNTTQFAI